MDNGTLDISGVTTTTEIGPLSGSGAILLGDRELIVNESTSTTYSGTIQGVNGSFQKLGTGTLTLSGTSSYTGATTVSAGILQAGAANAFAPASSFTVSSGATLDLNNFSNTILNLNGAGNVTTGTAAGGILTLANASGVFSGGISWNGGLTIQGGTLSLTGTTNTYSGPTTIATNATLNAGINNSLSASSDFIVNGTLGLNGFSNTIKSLSGSGAVVTGGAGTFTITNGGNFSGGITGTGLLDLTGGTLRLSGTNLNTYSGQTTLSNSAILQAGANNAFSPNSAFVLNDTSAVNLNGFNQTLLSSK